MEPTYLGTKHQSHLLSLFSFNGVFAVIVCLVSSDWYFSYPAVVGS